MENQFGQMPDGNMDSNRENEPDNQGGYDQNSYNQNGYNQNNYDQNSYNQNSYDQNSYNQNSYDQNGYHQNSYNQNGGYTQNYYAPNQGYQPNYNNQAPGMDTSPMSMGDWLLTSLALLIPCAGIILYFVWAFGSHGNINRRNFCRAQLIMMGVILVLYIIVAVILGVSFAGAMSAY